MYKELVKYLMILSMVIGLLASPMNSFAAEKEKVYYVGLGDSLAAGQKPFGGIGKGYTDFIAEKIAATGLLKGFVKDYAVPGYTTKNVLDDIVNNVNKGQNGTIQSVISHATHITLDAGANDLLHLLVLDKVKGTISYDPQQFKLALGQIQENLDVTIMDIKTINPTAKVYLMGYYNPMPHLPQDNQALLNASLGYLNGILQGVATKTGAVFVPVDKTIEGHLEFLPNPQDVHLSEDGYKAVSDQFWNAMKNDVVVKPQPGDGKTPAVVYWEGMLLKKGQIGKIVIQHPINLWNKVNGKLVFIRTLKKGETFRVYSFSSQFGGQYGLGGTLFVSKINKLVQYKTPSKEKIDLVNQ